MKSIGKTIKGSEIKKVFVCEMCGERTIFPNLCHECEKAEANFNIMISEKEVNTKDGRV